MTGPPVPASRLIVLHALRCMGYAGEERIASAAGAPTAETVRVLSDLTTAGLVTHHEGPFGGWVLTEEGRATDAEWIAAELVATGSRDQVMEAYGDFLGLNPKLLAVCHAWQVRAVGGVSLANDHRDAEYDFAVIDRLFGIDRQVQPILGSLSNRLSRFSTYRVRLAHAMHQVDAGDHGYFTDGLESYHTVWFQLHEDLLSTLGIERWTER